MGPSSCTWAFLRWHLRSRGSPAQAGSDSNWGTKGPLTHCGLSGSGLQCQLGDQRKRIQAYGHLLMATVSSTDDLRVAVGAQVDCGMAWWGTIVLLCCAMSPLPRGLWYPVTRVGASQHRPVWIRCLLPEGCPVTGRPVIVSILRVALTRAGAASCRCPTYARAPLGPWQRDRL